MPDLLNLLQEASDAEVPALAREALRSLIAELHALEQRKGARGRIRPEVPYQAITLELALN